jgi:hypothetical protein
VRLSFAPNGREATPAGAVPDGYHYEILAQASEAEAQVWVKGMEAPRALAGRATLIHAWTQGAEWDSILRRIELFSTQAGPRLHLVDFTTPKGERTGWLGLTDSHGETVFSDTDFQIRMSGAKQLAGETRYWVPESLHVESPSAKGEIVLKRIAAEHDPLGDIPQPFRFIVSLSMRPHRVWADAEFEVTLRPGPTAHSLHHQGAGVAVVTFLNPVSLP